MYTPLLCLGLMRVQLLFLSTSADYYLWCID